MADKGRWVTVPANMAPGNGGFDLGALFRNNDYRAGFGPWSKDSPALRWQNPDGSLQLLGPGNARPTSMRAPAWQAPPQPGNHKSDFAGAREANLQRINRDPQFADPVESAPSGPVTRASTTPAPAAPAPGDASLSHASGVVQSIAGSFPSTPAMPPMETAQVGVDGSGLSSPAPVGSTAGEATGAVRSAQDLELARRSAFLNGSDSMAGLKAMRGVLSDEVKARGGSLEEGGPIPSIKFLEAQLAKLQPKTAAAESGRSGLGQAAPPRQATHAFLGGAGDEGPATGTPAVEGGGLNPSQIAQVGHGAQTPDLAPSGAARAGVNAYLQSDVFKSKIRGSDTPLNEIARWQLTPGVITAPRTDPGREARLAAFAAQKESAPQTEAEALLAVGASNPYGTRNGQFKPGNTLNLGFVDPSQLPPLNSSGHYSGVNPGNYF
jgi:hypothetical protein